MADEMLTEPRFPSRLTSADRAQIESQTQRIGAALLAASLEAQPSLFSPDHWMQQASEWATQDEELKVSLFRLVDCMPMLDDPAALDRHVREYLSEDVIARLPGGLRTALQAARSGILAPLAARAVRGATLAQARRFIAGTNPVEAARAALAERRAHRAFTLDLLGEAVTSAADADAYAAAYEQLLVELSPVAARWSADPRVDQGPDGALPRVNVSLKLSALDSQFDAIDPEGTTARVTGRLRPLMRLARRLGAQIHVDMESHATKDLTLAIFKTVALEEEFRDWHDFGIVLQAYLRDTVRDLPELAAWARTRGTPVWVRLVKGAYWDYETIHARAAGWPVPVWEQKWQTDACYEAATTCLLEQADVLRPALGSHNLRSLAHGMAVAGHLGLAKSALEIQMLYGMGDPEKRAVTESGWRLRVYMPYGQLVPGMAYLVRRLLENSSNESFLRAGFVQHVPAEVLLAPPRAPVPPVAATVGPDPDRGGDPFHNEPLTDFADPGGRRSMRAALERFTAGLEREGAVVVPVVIDGRESTAFPRLDRHDPSDLTRLVARVSMPPAEEAIRAVDAAARGLAAWRAVAVAQRAEAVRRAAGILRRRRYEFAALQVHEVGKTWREADADVAEAIDFCEYYARGAVLLGEPRAVDIPGEENVTGHLPRGVCAVIAPWNFPLAILAGMTTAALVTGNTVVMKPAEQASLTGLRLHEVLLEAGVSPTALQFLPGRGEDVGAALVTHPATSLRGAGGWGGRRDDPADHRRARWQERDHRRRRCRPRRGGGGRRPQRLRIPGAEVLRLFTGHRPRACLRRVRRQARARRAEPRRRAGGGAGHADRSPRRRGGAGSGAEGDRGWPGRGWVVGPTVFTGVDPAGPLGQEEFFGPVLAVIRARDFRAAIAIANGTDYALTAGVFSRSPANLELARRDLEAGNVYLNRGITGALVARQPFGGYRMSGIGSKAGGPDYLLQFVVPRTVTENTLRRGFAPTRPSGAGRRHG